jgi:methionyl-tRNA formyltransferase
LNVHGSLLPKYRGAAPIQWAILDGEPETGITIMRMDEGLDTGDMLLTGAIPLTGEETTATLVPQMALLGGQLLCQALDLLRAGKLVPQKQDDRLATLAPPLKKEDGVIYWHRTASAISGQIRGLDPWPGANTTLAGSWLRLFRPQVITHPVGEAPGTLCRADANGLLIATGDNYLLVRELQREGGKRLPVDAFLRGNRLEVGLCFGSPADALTI